MSGSRVVKVKKLAVLIGVLLVVASLLPVALAAQGLIVSCDVGGNEKNTFGLGDTVYVIGYGLAFDNTVDVYVVNDVSPWTDGMAIPAPVIPMITTTSGAVQGILTLGVVGNGANEIPAPGDYDIVYDSDQDGTYDTANDLVDYQLCTGFHTIPEFVTMAIPVAIVLLGAFFFFGKRKREA